MKIIKSTKRGFTLVELMIVVAIVGVLAALAIYGVRKYVLNAKTAEARNTLGQMSKDAATAFNREGMEATILALGDSTGNTNHLCGQTGVTVPAGPTDIQGKKYQSTPSEWSLGDKFHGWPCLHFSMESPHYYMYGYASSGTAGSDGDTFLTSAAGDLDGDGNLSNFSISGAIQQDGDELVVTVAPNIEEIQPEE